MKILSIYKIILPLFFFCHTLQGQSNSDGKANYIVDSTTIFQNFTIEDGLPSNRILDIFQDRYGYFWFATNSGLSRFDGVSFKNFFFDATNPSSISNNNITRITEDSNGHLWIGTTNGLNKLNREDYSFTRFLHDNYDIYTLPGNHIRALLPDADGVLWIETGNGFLSRLDTKAYKFENYEHQASSHQYPCHSITKLKNQKLLILGREISSKIFDIETKTFTIVATGTPTSNGIATCAIDNTGKIWFGNSAKNYLYYTDSTFQESIKYPHPVGSIYDMLTDETGQIWMGGYSGGALRLDGKDKLPTVYRHSNANPNSILHNQVNKIYQDNHKSLWFATSGGVSRMIRNNYIQHIKNKNGSNNITAIVEGSDSTLWIGTSDEGLFQYDRKIGTYKNWKRTKKITDGIIANQIQTLYLDKDNQLWIGFWAGVGFQIFDTNTGKFEQYAIDKGSNIFDWYGDILETASKDIYLGVWGSGFYKFDKKVREFEHFDLNGTYPNSFQSTDIKYANGKIWSYNHAYCPESRLHRGSMYTSPPPDDKDKKTTRLQTTNPHLYWTVQTSKNFRIHQKWSQSNQPYNFDFIRNQVWIPTKEGLFVLDTVSHLAEKLILSTPDTIIDVAWNDLDSSVLLLSRFHIHTLDKKQENIIQSIKIVPELAQLKDNHLLVKKGQILLQNQQRVSVYNMANGQWADLPVKDEIKSVALIDDSIWIAFADCLKLYNTKTLQEKNSLLGHPYFRLIKRITKIKATSSDTLWVGTTNGLFQIDLSNDVTIPYFHSENIASSLLDNKITDIEEGKNGELWISTAKGLTRLLADKKHFEHHHYPTNDGISSRYTYTLLEDSQHNIWIGNTQASLDYYNPETGVVKHFFHRPWNSKSVNPIITALYEDTQQNIWIGSSTLSKFNRTTQDFTHFKPDSNTPFNEVTSILEDDNSNLWLGTDRGLYIFHISSNEFKFLGLKDNIQGLEFSRAACRLSTNELVFGGKNGFNIIDLKDYVFEKIESEIPSFNLKTENLYFEYELRDGITIQLPESESNLNFELAIFDTDLEHKFRYRLLEIDSTWTESFVTNRQIRFENLTPGFYTLQIGQVDKSGLWSKNWKEIGINIAFPFWEKWWFKLISLIVVLAVFYFIVKNTIRKAQRENELNLKVKFLHLKTLQAQINPHFIYNVLSSIQYLVLNGQRKDAAENIGDLGKLMRRFLEHSVKFDDAEENQKDNDIVLDEEIELIELYVKFEKLTYGDKFDFQLTIDPDINTSLHSIPPMLIQPYVENAIKHGILLQDKPNYRGLLQMDISQEEDEFLIFKIIDNGVGIAKAKEIQKASIKSYKSRGGKLVADRIKTLQELGYEVSTEIQDRPKGGTIVKIKIQI